jgi:hypothetical protein
MFSGGTNREGRIRHERGAYLICDNGYLRWPETIPPYVGEPSSMVEGYFSSNLESVRKDVIWYFEEALEDFEWRISVPQHPDLQEDLRHMCVPSQLSQ